MTLDGGLLRHKTDVIIEQKRREGIERYLNPRTKA
jgi:hypothetical protein